MAAPIGKTNQHARALRFNSTDAERLLWSKLRNRQLAGLKFRRQATVGTFVADFLCAELKMIVEADGGQHQPEADRKRTAFLEGQGFQVLRFWNNDILENIEGVLAMILSQSGRAKPSPNPLPQAGEGL